MVGPEGDAMKTTTAEPDLPLRERKKALMRQAILDNAKRLFDMRGYDQVTVAEIADAANVSVKTLFTYFRSKEDLVFQDSRLIDSLLAELKARPPGTSPAAVVATALTAVLRQSEHVAADLEGFDRGYGQSETLRWRILRLWAEYEDAVAQALALEAGLDAPSAELKFLAVQLIGLVRSVTWREVHALTTGKDNAAAANALGAWFGHLADRIDLGQGRI
jgi:AcrR family transcriptional regulator